MDNNFQNLLNQFKKISRKRYIKGVKQSYGGIGLTFERELGKSPDSNYNPDYDGIEIKCTSRFSHYPLYLFTVAFDGPDYNEIMRIVENYGYPDKDFPDKNVIFAKLNCKYFSTINGKYNFILDLDEKEERLYLCVYDMNYKLIERISYIFFSTLINHLNTKLKKLALVYASQRKEEVDIFYRYYRILLFKLKSKEIFLNLLKEGTIKVDLISRISKSGQDRGRYRNKNLEFEISKDELEKLFDKVYEYEI